MGKITTMIPIKKVAKLTGISVNTIRYWARTGQLREAVRDLDVRGFAWYTTVRSVEERYGAKRLGRPPKIPVDKKLTTR